MKYFYSEKRNEVIGYDPVTGDVEAFRFIHEVVDKEVDNEIEETEEAPKKKNGRGNYIRACKACGKGGHNRKTCPGDQRVKKVEQEKDIEVDFDDDMKDEINEMLLEGKGSREIADFYGLSVKDANYVIARAKGIMLPR